MGRYLAICLGNGSADMVLCGRSSSQPCFEAEAVGIQEASEGRMKELRGTFYASGIDDVKELRVSPSG